MPYSEAQKKATLKWKAKAIKRYEINLHKENDADIIEFLEGKNVQGEFKRLMRSRIDHNIFTNKQINLLKLCIDLRVNQLVEDIEDEEENIRTDSYAMEKAKENGIDHVAERKRKMIAWSEADIKKTQKDIAELKELRDYIDGAYYGE